MKQPSGLVASVFLVALTLPSLVQCKSVQSNSKSEIKTIEVSQEPTGFDTNDITWLFPIGPDKLPFPNIDASEFMPIEFIKSVNQEFFEQRRDQIMAGQSNGGGIGTLEERSANMDAFVKAYNDFEWKIVGMRYDPCAPTSHGEALEALVKKSIIPGCLHQFRLTIQPFGKNHINGAVIGDDTSLHAVYTHQVGPVTESSAFIEDLLDLKRLAEENGVKTAGMPLDVHPMLVKEMQSPDNTPYINALKKIMKRLTPKHLNQIASFSRLETEMSDDRGWGFKAGTVGTKDVNGNCKADVTVDKDPSKLCFTPTNVPVMPGISVFRIFCNRGGCESFPQMTHKDNIGKFRVSNEVAAAPLVARIDNPDIHNFFTMDCVGCHATSGVIKRTKLTPTNGWVTSPVGVTPYISGKIWKNRNVWNLRNLGIAPGQQPTANTRTGTESAYAADYLNRSLGLKNPGKDCSGNDETGKSINDQVWECFRSEKEDCMKLCK